MAKLNKNRIKLGDIVFVSMKNVTTYDDFVGKMMGTEDGYKAVVRKANGGTQIMFINRCSHANETQKKHYFKDVLRYG